MEQDYIWNLIAKKLSGEAMEDELQELEMQLRKSPELHYPMQTIIDLWRSEQGSGQQEAHHAFNRHIERMQHLNVDYEPRPEDAATDTNKGEKYKRHFLWFAFSISVVVCASFFGFKFLRTDAAVSANSLRHAEKAISEVSTKNGFKTNLILPDGTKVWLNAGSSLTYDSAYGKSIREVALSGEAFFDVVKNKEKPFVIHTSKINIKVLGTEFNVRSYPTDKTTEASLIRGSIEVTFKDKPDKKIILKPNEKIVVENFGRVGKIIETSHQDHAGMVSEVPGAAVKNLTYQYKTGAIIETSWVENKLIFQDESFEDIARQLERWYGVSITFENSQLKANHLTGNFKNETIRQALDALKFTATFNYEIDNSNNITIF